MSRGRVEIVRTPKGEYKVQMVGYDGPPIRVAKHPMGIKRTAADRKAGRESMQRVLKALYEKQQAVVS